MKFEFVETHKKYIYWFGRLWNKNRGELILITFFTILTVAVKTAFPIFLKYLIDVLDSEFQINHAYKLIIAFLLFGIIHELILHALPFVRAFMNMKFTVVLRSGYYKLYSKKNLSFFKRFRTGDLLTRLTDDIDGGWDRISWYSCSGIMRPIEAALILIFTLSVMFSYSAPLTLFSFIPLPFLVLILAKTEDRMVRYTDEKQEAISNCNNVLEACFSGIRVIKTSSSERDQIKKYYNALDIRVKKEKNFLFINEFIHFFSLMVNHAGSIIVIFVGSYLFIQNKITLGTFLLFIIYLERFIEPLWTLSWFYASSKQVFRYVDRLLETEDFGNRDIESENGRTEKIETFENLVFENVSFRFEESEKNVLSDISFRIEKGETIAVVGAVGSGKTTLLELIAGNLEPSAGTIYFNNKSLDTIDRDYYANQVGYVRQENVLFSESILHNLLLGNEFTKEQISESLSVALMTEELKQFPKGLDTMLGQKGLSLSGGQKQRLSIARTFIRKPKLLLLDDCTAAMDAHTEKIFWSNLKEYLPNTAVIVVTHRLATAMKTDKVMVIDDNRIVEFDSHDNLKTKQSVYNKIMTNEDHGIELK